MFEGMKKKLVDKLLGISNISNAKEARNIERQLQKNALLETTRFVEENMLKTRSFENKFSLLKYALDLIEKRGLILEFGVFEGTTINFISSNTKQTVYGFDSFEGLPEDWREGFEKGTFKIGIPEVNKNVKLIKGWFDDTLPQFIKECPENCYFIHIDCDLYSSTKTIFDNLHDKIKEGTIIVFDEFFNYPGWKEGEYKAFIEFVNSHNIKYEYIGYCRYDEQVALKILEVNK
ncbi:TylF/MycF/NovP-related O-methyltransferase [Methanobacterium sp.]|uniref:TylF/MycF/NovP-related O-methyltransferase n=1 Tax=Methanobacterium sp. TaxID=2164 RepID=UPI003C7216C7